MDEWRVYKDKAGEYRWHRKALNGEVVGASTEGYKNLKECIENAYLNGAPPEVHVDEGE